MKFLIVDDDPLCRELLRVILSPYGQCDLAFDGSEAVDAFRLALEDEQPYDLVCLDIMMPGTDGHQALEEIRQIERARGIGGRDATKVLMATALLDSKHCIRAFEEGCEAYCTKPLKQEDILRHVRSLLGGLPQAEQPESIMPQNNPPAQMKRFLVVDDDGVCRALVKAILSTYGECAFAYDGQEAIDAFRLALEDGKPFDLITLDIMMPGVNGHDALEGIRKLEAEHGVHGSDGVKVVMTTALRDSKHCIRSFKEGCECYVTKPIDEDELLGKLRELGVIEESQPAGA